MVGNARPAARVLVSGGGGTGSWNALDAARAGAHVDWIGRVGRPRDPALDQELRDISARLASPDLDPAERARLSARQVDLQSFSGGMLDRNLGGDGAFAHPAVHRHSKEIALITPSEHMTEGPFAGRPGKVHVRFSDDSSDWYDYVIVSHGLDASRPGGAVAITRDVDLHLRAIDDFPLIESTDGAIRILGAPTYSPEWEGKLPPAQFRLLKEKRDERARELSPHSRGIAESIEMTGRQISIVNADLATEKNR